MEETPKARRALQKKRCAHGVMAGGDVRSAEEWQDVGNSALFIDVPMY